MLKKKMIMICGDSISKGIIYDSIMGKYRKYENAFAKILENKLKVKILNISGFGNTIGRAEKKFFRIFKEKKPDLVLICLGGNDCDFNWDKVAEEPLKSHEPKTDIIDFRQGLDKMIGMVKENGKKPILLNLAPLDPERFFNWVSKNDEKRKSNIMKWLGSVSKIYWWQERYNSAVVETARRKNVELIDIRSAFLNKYDFRECICEDGIHPNAKGQQLIADIVLKHLI